MSLSDDDKRYFGVDPEFLTRGWEYLIRIPLFGIYMYQVPLIIGSSIVCVCISSGVKLEGATKTYPDPKPVGTATRRHHLSIF